MPHLAPIFTLNRHLLTNVTGKQNNKTDFNSEERKYRAIDKGKQSIKEGTFNIPGVVMTWAYRSTSGQPQHNTTLHNEETIKNDTAQRDQEEG